MTNSINIPMDQANRLDAVFTEVKREITYQNLKWGEGKAQSLPGYMLIMRKELEEAEGAWMKNETDSRQSPLEEILQVVTVGMRCLAEYGVRGSARATNDIREGGKK